MSDKELTDEEKLKKFKCMIRVVNLVTGLMMVGYGIGGFIFLLVNSVLKLEFFLAFSPIFMVLFGLLILGAEFNIKRLTNKVALLNSLLGRGIFNIYMSSNVFFYFGCGDNKIVWLAWLLASIMFAIGIFYIVLYFCFGGRKAEKDQEMQSPTVKQQML